jgi:hypothetical protein
MPLPDDFSPAEHLQDLVLNIQNKIVREEFSDLGDETWTPDISTARGSLRVGCTHLDEDSIDMTLTRLWLFYGVTRKCIDFHPAIYGVPSQDFQDQVRFHPQIHLHFEETPTEAETGYRALRAQVGFRLMTETTETLSRADCVNYANKIKTLFHSSSPFFWKKGKELWAYNDPRRGYHFQIYAFGQSDAKKVIEQVMDIQSHSPDWKLLNSRTNAEPSLAYPTVPPAKSILGKAYKQPRVRPVGTVRFRYAVLHIYGKPDPVVLVDPHHSYKDALVR